MSKPDPRKAVLFAYVDRAIAWARGETDQLDILPSVRFWDPDETSGHGRPDEDEAPRLTRVRSFSQFVSAELHVLAKLASHPGFFTQHACNSARSGPVTEGAEAAIEAEDRRLFLLRSPGQRPAYNPFPGLVRTIEVYGDRGGVGGVLGVICASTADGGMGITALGTGVLEVWDLETGKRLKTLEGHEDRVTCLSVTPDGRRAVSGGEDGMLCLWNLQDGHCLRRFEAGVSPSCVWIRPDGERAFSGGLGELTVWDLERAEPIRRIECPTMSVGDLSATLDGRLVITLSRPRWSSESTLELWDPESGQRLRELEGQNGTDNSVRLSVDGRIAVSANSDKHLWVWNLETGQCLHRLPGHSGWVRCAAITADGKRAVSSGDDKTIRLWDLEASRCVKAFAGHTDRVMSLDLTPDGAKAVSGSVDGTLRTWDVERGTCAGESEKHLQSVESLDLTADGQTLISGGEDLTIRTWDLETGKHLDRMGGEEVRHPKHPDRRAIEGRSRMVFTPGGKRVVFKWVTLIPDEWEPGSGGRAEEELRVWDPRVGELLRIAERVQDLELSPSGRRAVAGTTNNDFRIWDLENGECLGEFGKPRKGYVDLIRCVSMSPDGQVVATARSSGTVRLWGPGPSGFDCLRTMERQGIALVLADGRRVALGHRDGSISVVHLNTGEVLGRFVGCTSEVKSLRVTPDCKNLVSGSADGTVRVWDLEHGKCLGIHHAGAGVTALSEVSSTGTFAYGTGDGQVVLLAMRNLSLGPMVLTPTRFWLFGDHGAAGRWDDHLSADCPWCGGRFPVPKNVLDVIDAICRSAGVDSGIPSLQLPDSAWEEESLHSECPACRRSLRFNPFLADELEWLQAARSPGS
jgi:WD40 repeat protein